LPCTDDIALRRASSSCFSICSWTRDNLFCDWLAGDTCCAPIPWPVGGVGWMTLLHAVARNGESAAACVPRSPSRCCCGKRRDWCMCVAPTVTLRHFMNTHSFYTVDEYLIG
jgi:hypothetical protein